MANRSSTASMFMYNVAMEWRLNHVLDYACHYSPPYLVERLVRRPVNRGITLPVCLFLPFISLTFFMGLSHFIPALDSSLLYTVSFIRPLLSYHRWVSRFMHDCLTVTLGVVAFIAFFYCIYDGYFFVGDLEWVLCGDMGMCGHGKRDIIAGISWAHSSMATSEPMRGLDHLHAFPHCADAHHLLVIWLLLFHFLFVFAYFYVDSVIYELIMAFFIYRERVVLI